MAVTSRPSDDRANDERPSQLDHPPSTSTMQQQQHRKSSRDSEARRCCGCNDQWNSVPYTIEDLDAIELAPLDNQSGNRTCCCEQANLSKQLENLRKHRSTETRWSNSFLSPDDARWDPRKFCTSDDTEFRWALHTSRTDVDIARSAKMKCGCHSLTPVEKKSERGDLRKHHSAETDKWTLGLDVVTPRRDLRKHNSDDGRIDRQQTKWTLLVPEVLPDLKPRYVCSKTKRSSPIPAEMNTKKETADTRLVHSRSLTPKEPAMSAFVEVESKDLRWTLKSDETKDRVNDKEEGSTRKWERVASPENNLRAARLKWPSRSQFPVSMMETNETKWTKIHGSFGESSNDCRGVKEKQRSVVRKNISPERSARTLLRANENVKSTGRPTVSPEITITDPRWTSCEEHSTLSSVDIKKKRQQMRISDIKWIPCYGSSNDLSHDQSNPINWSPFRNVTPTCYPPSQSRKDDSPDETRWKLLNQVSPFPIYQGAWKNDSPPEILKQEEPTQSIWSRQASSPLIKSLSMVKSHSLKTRKQHESNDEPTEERPAAQQVLRGNRQRPQLMRSKALLEVPVMDPTKRSLSEEVPRYRMNEEARGPNRAHSEEAPKYENPWFANNLVFESAELCQYVTTV